MVITTAMIAVGAKILCKEIQRQYNDYKRQQNK
jgi:hypothetical protein